MQKLNDKRLLASLIHSCSSFVLLHLRFRLRISGMSRAFLCSALILITAIGACVASNRENELILASFSSEKLSLASNETEEKQHAKHDRINRWPDKSFDPPLERLDSMMESLQTMQ
jgi:hypothetical protein